MDKAAVWKGTSSYSQIMGQIAKMKGIRIKALQSMGSDIDPSSFIEA